MFERLKEICERGKNINENDILHNVFENKNIQDKILSLQLNEQLYLKGVDINEESLGEYSDYTIFYKQNIAGLIGNDTRADNITLKDTGQMYESARIINEKSAIIISMDTMKDGQDLQTRFGQFVGLTQNSKDEIIEDIKEPIKEEIRKYITG